MSSQFQHTTSEDAWVRDVLARLPAEVDLDALAREHGAWTRRRAFPSAADLLRGLLAYAVAVSSLRSLGAWGVLSNVADLAPASWLERLRASGSFLQSVVTALLHIPRPRYLSQLVGGRVLLVDATRLRLHGGTGNDARLHLAYDVLASQFAQVVLTDGRGAEKVQHYTFKPHDLLVLDAGYGYRSQVATIQEQRADAVVRIYPPTFPLERADGHVLALRDWLDQPGCDQRSRRAYYTHQGTRYGVRVLAMRQGELQRQAAIKRAKNRARKRERPLSGITQYYADWVVLLTTLLDEETWPEWTIWRLYGARWQIELVFKRAKQLLGLGQLRCRTLESAVPLVWAVLLMWVVHEGVVREVRAQLLKLAQVHPSTYPGQSPKQEAVVSAWGCHDLTLTTLIAAIRGHWTLARIEACLPRLRRFLVTHPRSDRQHQGSEVVAWLSGQRRTRSRPLTDPVC